MIKINWTAGSVSVNGSIHGKLSFDDMAMIEAMLKDKAIDIVTGPTNNGSLAALQLISDAFGIDMEQDFSAEESPAEEQLDLVDECNEQSPESDFGPVSAVG